MTFDLFPYPVIWNLRMILIPLAIRKEYAGKNYDVFHVIRICGIRVAFWD